MQHSRNFHDKIIERVKRDEGFRWEPDYIAWLRELQRSVHLETACDYGELLDSRLMCLQQESFARALDEQRVELQGTDNDEAYVYPGLTIAWETKPVTLDIEPSLLRAMAPFDPTVLDTPLRELSRLFPACLAADIRSLGFSMHGVEVGELFAYPTYDIERGYAALLLLGVSYDNGLMFPLQSKLVLKGETFGDAMAASHAEQRLMADLWRRDGRLERLVEAFSPLDDDLEFMELAAHLLAMLCSERSRLNRTSRKAGEHVWAVAAPVPAADKPQPQEDAHAKQAPAVHAKPAESALPQLEEDPRDERIAELERSEQELRSRLAALTYSLELAHTATAKLQQHTASLQKRAELVEAMQIPTTPVAALSLAAEAFLDRIVVLDDAVRSCRDYKGSAAEVWAVLQAIACHLHPLVMGGNAGDVEEQFRSETGFELALRDTKATKSNRDLKRLRQCEYKGQLRDITPHVKGKGTKRGQTLRVHFFADYDAQVIVIAHCGEHLESASSANK